MLLSEVFVFDDHLGDIMLIDTRVYVGTEYDYQKPDM